VLDGPQECESILADFEQTLASDGFRPRSALLLRVPRLHLRIGLWRPGGLSGLLRMRGDALRDVGLTRTVESARTASTAATTTATAAAPFAWLTSLAFRLGLRSLGSLLSVRTGIIVAIAFALTFAFIRCGYGRRGRRGRRRHGVRERCEIHACASGRPVRRCTTLDGLNCRLEGLLAVRRG
jgi:hypothetical protein